MTLDLDKLKKLAEECPAFDMRKDKFDSANFIAFAEEARTAVPQLIDLVKKQRERMAELERERDEAHLRLDYLMQSLRDSK